MTRRTTRAIRGPRFLRPVIAGAAMMGAALTLSGCFYLSPDEVKVYDAADGVAASVGTVRLSDVLIVTSAKGAAGTLHGTATNPTQQAVELVVTPAGGAATTVSIPAVTAVRLDGAVSGNSTATAGPVDIAAVASAPGTSTEVTFATRTGGSVPVSVPVMLNVSPYGSATPQPNATYDAPTGTEAAEH